MARYSKRLGRFYIHGETIAGAYDTDAETFRKVTAIMSHVFILEARQVLYMDAIEYLGISPLFEELKDGENTPEYAMEGQSMPDENGGTRYVVKAFRREPRCSFCGQP